jgi:hypothetical protein
MLKVLMKKLKLCIVDRRRQDRVYRRAKKRKMKINE